MKIIDVICGILLAIGGLNWLLVGLFDFNLVSFIFADSLAGQKIIYILVGLSAVYQIIFLKLIWKRWKVEI